MTEIESLLIAYQRGQATLDDLDASLSTLTAASPQAVANALEALEAARASGLSEDTYATLRRKLSALGGGDPTILGSRDHPDTDTTAMERGIAGVDEPTELNPAAGYSNEEVALRRQSIREDGQRRRAGRDDERTDPTFTDMGLIGTGEEPTGTFWPGLYDEARPGLHGEKEFQKGDVLRGRFKLTAKLGEGGMGAVWKGKDLLKEEAKDRNPYVAIKLLQADFKKHPEAFIALQRETSKQQRLAHPNIATVYDFDRDERTQTVFMTMEVMEGQPMDAFVRALPNDGLPVDQAMGIIEQLAAGLAYAHDNGLVHSDLKPGNCFITSDGTVKLLDFGIARASKTKADADGETTLFDPAELGALTPTYATLEMFEGEDPDPRDDIFALAILAYQLLTGRHPYGKKSAPKANELNLRPSQVAKLSTRQNRGLARGLALHRHQRTPSVERFLDDIRRRHSTVAHTVVGALAALLLIAVLAYKPALNLLSQQQREDVITALERPGMENIRATLAQAAGLGDQELRRILDDERTKRTIIAHISQTEGERLEQWLEFIGIYDVDWQRDIFDDERARAAIVEHYEKRIFDAFDPARKRYDFARARQQVDALDGLYPDSATVLEIRTELENRRDNALDRLSDQFNRFLRAGLLIPDEKGRHIGDVLSAVRQIAPTHRLLSDDRLRLRYGELAEQARVAGDYARADALVQAGLEHAPEDPTLKDLRFQIQAELARIGNERRAADVEARLTSRLGGLRSMGDFDANREDLLILADLNPLSPTLERARVRLERVIDAELGRTLAANRSADAEQLLLAYAPLLGLEYLISARDKLPVETSTRSGVQPPRSDNHPDVATRLREVEILLVNPRVESVWQAALERHYKELIVLLPEGNPILEDVRDRIADYFLREARIARESGRFNEALTFLDNGRRFHADYPPFAAEAKALAVAQARLREDRDNERRAALAASIKADFAGKAETNQVQEAKRLLAELEGYGLSRDDPFLREVAPHLLADAYARLATARARQEDYSGAMALANAGLEQWPAHSELRANLASYEIALESQRTERALAARFADSKPLDVSATSAELARLKRTNPDRYPELLTGFSRSRADALLAVAARSQPIGDGLRRELAAYRALFPDQYAALEQELAAVLETRLRALSPASAEEIAGLGQVLANTAGLSANHQRRLEQTLADSLIATIRTRTAQKAENGHTLLVAARALLPEHQRLAALEREVPLPEVAAGLTSMDAGELGKARRHLDAALARESNHPSIPPFRRALEQSMRGAEAAYAAYARDIADAKPVEQQAYDDRHSRIVALWRDNPSFERVRIRAPRKGQCHPVLAGYGNQSGGSCYDLIGDQKGPEMVVVPPGNGIDMAYAIGKYEISVTDFNLYCELSASCEPRASNLRRLPVTGISIADAEDYANWLSREASRNAGRPVVYRLPTAAEWGHAARAEGQQPERKFNCRVVSAGEVIAGHALVDAWSGQQNAWGLANYAGNAQEWVHAGQELAVRGGAYEDPLTKCGTELAKPHTGDPDELTGFRLVRELG